MTLMRAHAMEDYVLFKLVGAGLALTFFTNRLLLQSAIFWCAKEVHGFNPDAGYVQPTKPVHIVIVHSLCGTFTGLGLWWSKLVFSKAYQYLMTGKVDMG